MDPKTYKSIAQVMHSTRDRLDLAPYVMGIDITILQLAKLFYESDPEFKFELFLEACNYNNYNNSAQGGV